MAVPILLTAILAACGNHPAARSCNLNAPEALAPPAALQVRTGMSLNELELLLGPASYSPSAGQYYFSTGGDCPLDEDGRTASCGLVADFRADRGDDIVVTPALRSCWWGAIGE